MTSNHTYGSPPAEDFFLRALIQVINTSPDLEIGMTLSVNGALISGRAVSWRRYFAGNAKLFRDTGQGKTNEKTINALALAFDTASETQSELESQYPELAKEIHFVHLMDAKFFVGTDPVSEEGTWWRGRLAEVDGFTIGNLTIK